MSELLVPDVPIEDPDRGYRQWHWDEIYDGVGPGRYVPNVDDSVWSWDTGLWRVVEVDRTTGKSKLIPYVAPKKPDSVTNEDVLIGVNVGHQAESYRVYLDSSVIPHTLAVDSRLHVYGTTASSVKIFRGYDIGESGEVISAMYDQSGTLLGENIPLELVAMPDQHNVAVKTPMVGNTLVKLQDGEVVTVVVYDDMGKTLSIVNMLVKNTSFIRTTEASRKYVKSIHLESPFLDESDDRLVRFPVNMPTNALPLTGVVTYSNGETLRLPANGGKFNLYGLNTFVASIVGQKAPLVLSYKLSEDEYCYGASPGHNKHVSEKYWATTTEFEEAFNVKLFGYPVWIDDVNGYRLDFFLSSLDRQEIYNVTDSVTIAETSAAFDPLKYGVKQQLAFVVNMADVDAKWPSYRHVQTMEITLMERGDVDATNWLVGFEPGQDPLYGHDLKASVEFVNTNDWRLNLSNGYGSKEAWLNAVYYPTHPLYHPHTEARAPVPNFIAVVFKRRRYEFPIDAWNDDVIVVNDLNEGETLYVEFIRRTHENDLYLGVSGLTIHQVTGS